ncbi:MAG: hypothetical protein J5822_02830 [Eubacteriaceae bacterium]|nr:hypothetical protein [Eubacteriaceae bacterium]
MKKGTVAKIVAAGVVSAAMFAQSGRAEAAYAPGSGREDSVLARTEQVRRCHVTHDDVSTEKEYAERLRRLRDQDRIRSLRDGILSMGVLAASVTAKTVLKLLGALAARLMGVSVTALAGFVGDVIINFLIISALFSMAFRILFPNRSLREMWSAGNILIMLCASLLIETVRYVCALFSSRAYFISELIQCLTTLSLVGYAYYRVFRLEGMFASALQRALKSRAGIFTAAALAFGSLFAVLIKTLLSGFRRFAAFSQLTGVFIICLLVVVCGIRLFRPVKHILLLKD